MTENEGKQELQRYMDPLVPPLNAALNTLAAQRPADPLRALVDHLGGSDQQRWGHDTLLVPSAELCALLKLEKPCSMNASQLLTQLAHTGALTRGIIAAESAKELAVVPSPNPLNRWQRALKPAIQKFKSGKKPWDEFEIHKQRTELCRRFDYDTASDSWQESETLVKMEDISFARGAMRECFRMKKMSQVNAHFFYSMDWKDCNNYVAKRYITTETSRETYFNDIKMQMVMVWCRVVWCGVICGFGWGGVGWRVGWRVGLRGMAWRGWCGVT